MSQDLTRQQCPATLPKGTPSFAELLQRLEGEVLSPTRKRDFASALRRAAKAIGTPLEQTFAHAPWLQPRLANVSPQAMGLSAKTWSNVISDVRGAIEVLDRWKPRVNRRKDLSPEWLSLFSELVRADKKFMRFGLSTFIFFLSQRGIAPDEVNCGHAAAYRDELVSTQLRKAPEETYRKAVLSWNRAGAAHAFWPQQKLSAPSRQTKIRPDLDDLPASFRNDLEAYLRSLSSPDPLADSGFRKPLRPASIKSRRDRAMLFAGALINSGIAAAEVTGLAALVRVKNVHQGLSWLFSQNGGEPLSSHVPLANDLVAIARGYVRASDSDIAELERFAANLKRRFPRRRGMTEKNLDRLRVFRDKEALAKLLKLPEKLFERGLGCSNTPKGQIMLRDAVMLAVLRNHPIRRKNLLNLRLGQNIQRTRTGSAYLVISASDVKNSKNIEFEIAPGLLNMIDTYLARRPPSQWLFPSPQGDKPLTDVYARTRIPMIVKRELGFDVHIHFARHLAAFVFLENRPGHYEEVRRLLGHSSTSVTLDVYAGFETDSVGRRFADMLQDVRSRPSVKVPRWCPTTL